MTKITSPVVLKDIASPKKMSAGKQIAKMITMLQQMPREAATEEMFSGVCAWVNEIAQAKRPDALFSAMAQAFNKPLEEIDLAVKYEGRRTSFDSLVPRSGWIHDYIEWTRQTEPPTVFHFFVAAAVIGASLGRNVFFDKGAYQVYPNMCIVIVAPTGRCRKTSACNLGTGLLQKVGGNVLADKTTPEALVDSLKTSANATGLIYAPELAVFLGKQKYQEGMVPLLTALLDCPKEWVSKTVGGGDRSLTNVALSALMCSTIDWLKTSIPADSFGGGFMSRFLFVIQESTPRSFPLPPPLDAEIKKTLLSALTKIKLRKGPFTLEPKAESWYRRWYNERPSLQGDKQYAGYFERKPDHILRLAMVLRISQTPPDVKELVLTEEDLIQSNRILTWLEAYLPATFDEMTSSGVGDDQARLLRHLRIAGGTMEHSLLLRKNASRINAEQFKRAMTTLRDAKQVEWDPASRTYTLTPEGWA